MSDKVVEFPANGKKPTTTPPLSPSKEESLRLQMLSYKLNDAVKNKEVHYWKYLNSAKEVGDVHKEYMGYAEVIKKKYGVEIGVTHNFDGSGNLVKK